MPSVEALERRDTKVFKGSFVEAHETRRFPVFLDRIGRSELKEIITSENPWSYWTMEIYRKDIKGQGGLGMLASDTVEIAEKLEIPMVVVTPFYTLERSHKIENFQQKETRQRITPEERGFNKVGETQIRTKVHDKVPLGIFVKKEGSVTILTVSEPNIGELYQDFNNSDHRFYQEIALGFGGWKALNLLGVKPSMNQQLNEAPTVFAALARLDARVQELKSTHPEAEPLAIFAKALIENKEKTIYTNHTLVQAAEAEFDLRQFEHFVFPNITSVEVKQWLRNKIHGKGGSIKLSTLAIDLSSKKNGVSKAHAREASRAYKDYDGNEVKFEEVTNGISLTRWGDPDILELYRRSGVIDDFDLPMRDFVENINYIDVSELRRIKKAAKIRLIEALKERQDQYGNVVNIPHDAKIFNWRRRIADYKRPGMLFEHPEKLANILKEENSHLIMAGNAHPSDTNMIFELKRILDIVDKNPVLKERVHFIQNYDEDLARVLVHGADISINTPVVKDSRGRRITTEACGTSWEKDILNNVILISTDDGGIADLTVEAEEKGNSNFRPSYLQINGDNYNDEVDSLYQQMRKAANIQDSDDAWKDYITQQLAAYLPIISGARMEADYINLGFPSKF